MESFNTGHVVETIAEESWEQAARDFSEGNEDLRKLLLYCFQNNLETKACCAGHPERFDGVNGTPYILFEYNENSSQAILSIIKKLIKQKGVELSLDNTNELFGKSFRVRFNTLEADWEGVLKACQNREKDGKSYKLPSTMRRIIDFLEKDEENVYLSEFTYETDSEQYRAIFSEIELDMLVDRSKYCFAQSLGTREKNGFEQTRYWFNEISDKKMKKLLKSFTRLRDKCDKEGKYSSQETYDETHDEINNESLIAAITGNATPADYEKAAQEWDARVPVDKGDLDKTNIER